MQPSVLTREENSMQKITAVLLVSVMHLKNESINYNKSLELLSNVKLKL